MGPTVRPHRRRGPCGHDVRGSLARRLGTARRHRGRLQIVGNRRGSRRRRRRPGRRSGLGRRSGRGRLRRRGRSRPWRQERERVEVALRIVRAADAEMHIRDVELEVARRADAADALALRQLFALGDGERTEMGQGDGVAVGGPDRRRPPVSRQPARERHGARRGRRNGGACRRADVDARVAVLVVLGAAEVEAPQDGTLGRPAPPRRNRRSCEREQEDAHGRCQFRQHLR
jgi:hypothetical protein